jgi:hypothetical protein
MAGCGNENTERLQRIGSGLREADQELKKAVAAIARLDQSNQAAAAKLSNTGTVEVQSQ